MDITVFMRLSVLISILISCIYGLRQIQKKNVNSYFLVILYGMISLFFSRFYYLMITLSDGNDSTFTIGILGQASAYLFFSVANTKYISKECTKKLFKNIYIPSLISTIILGIGFFIVTLKNNTLAVYISEIIYFLTMGNAFYSSLTVILNSNKIKECKYLINFNIYVCLLILINLFLELSDTFLTGNILMVSYFILTIITAIIIPIMLPILKRGVSIWKQ